MNIRTESERPRPSPQSYELVKRMAYEVSSDESDFSGWARDYIRRFSTRVAFDVDYVRRYVQPCGRLLECGSTPLLLTACLKHLNYDFTGIDIDPNRFKATLDQPGPGCPSM